MHTLIHERVEAAVRGENPCVICRMSSGWAVLGDHQFLPGCSLLLADPVVDDLNDLPHEDRRQFLMDMAALGDAVLALTDAYRINYSILGNKDPALHAHLHPRYESEPEAMKSESIWAYSPEDLASRPFDKERDDSLMNAMRQYLGQRGSSTPTLIWN